jgi:hypothetical protein
MTICGSWPKSCCIALVEIVTLEHARDRVARGKLDEPRRVHLAHPARVELNARFALIKNLEDLRLIGLGIGLDFLWRQRRTGRILPRRVADHPGEIADQEYDLMPQLLKLAHLVDQDRMPEMQVRCRRVKARLYSERPAQPELFLEAVLGQDLVRSAGQFRDMFVDGAHRREL